MTNPTPRRALTRFGFILAALYNFIGILGFTQFFTDQTIAHLDPVTFSWLGQLSILLWGAAYFLVQKKASELPHLVMLFAVEKAIYGICWLKWLVLNSGLLSELYSQNPIIAAFFSFYGLGDLAFMVFFARVALKTFRAQKAPRNTPNAETAVAEKTDTQA